jgi:large conductance mechanosensitive channel
VLSGFKNFILRGNLVELAVAFVMAAAFAAVVTATVDLLMDLIGKAGGTPDFSDYSPGGVSVGAWLTALVTFVIMAAVVYFFIVMPYTRARDRYFPSPEPGTPEDVKLLQEIRDLLAARQGGTAEEMQPSHLSAPDPTT